MIDGLKPYPEYNDSGVPWLGKIPSRRPAQSHIFIFASHRFSGKTASF